MSRPGANGGARVDAAHLSRRFGPHRALEDVSLAIEPGESFGLLGANGAGKTTFIRLVTGTLLPSSGEVRVDGFSPATDPDAVHARLGYVPESSRLYPELRVRELLRFAGGARGLAGAELAAALEAALSRFGLEPVARRVVGNLSKGLQQRLSLAQAFLHDPALVVVDEPTGGLDPLQRSEVQAILASLRGRRTLLLCTHDLEEARALTSRVAVLHGGSVVALGPTEAVLAAPDPTALFRDAPAAGPLSPGVAP